MGNINAKNSYITTSLIFMLVWFIYYLYEMLCGNLPGYYLKLMNLIPILFLALLSQIFNFFYCKSKGRLGLGAILSFIFILVSTDQIIKMIIRIAFSEEISIEIIKGWLYFDPVVNTSGSWAAVRYGMNFGIGVYTLINIMILPLIIQCYRFYNSRNDGDFWIDMFFVFMIAGGICSLIDKVFFYGSLDFIRLNSLFTADIKDIYITLSLCCLIVQMTYDEKNTFELNINEDIKLIRDFIAFSIKDLKLLIKSVVERK